MVIAKPSATLVVAPHTGATTSVSVVVYNLTCLELLLRIPSLAKRHRGYSPVHLLFVLSFHLTGIIWCLR